MDQVSSRPEPKPKPIHNPTLHPPQCDPVLSLAPIPIYPSIPARFAHLYRVEICLKWHHAPFPKAKTQPPDRAAHWGPPVRDYHPLPLPPKTPCCFAARAGFPRPSHAKKTLSSRKIDWSPQKNTPRFKNNSGRRPVPPSSTPPPPVALALLHRGYHQETKENGKSREMQESVFRGTKRKGWSAPRPPTQRPQLARRRTRFRHPGAPGPC
jgi:hypothetical protein